MNSCEVQRQKKNQKRKDEKKANDGQKFNLSMLSDDDLRAALLVYGFKPGPIVGSTRAVYERKLMKLASHHDVCDNSNVAEKVVPPKEQESQSDEDSQLEESSDELELVEEQECIEVDVLVHDGPVYQQCFLPSSRMHCVACASRNVDICHNLTSEQIPQSTQDGGAVQIPKETSSTSILDQPLGSGSKVSSTSTEDSNYSQENISITEMAEEVEKRIVPVTDSEPNESDVDKLWAESNRLDMLVVDETQSQYFTPEEETLSNWEAKDPVKEDLLPDIKVTSTKIGATCRRTIKGAAGRFVEYNRPKFPDSPITLERREIEHLKIPVQIRILVFVVVAFLLFFIVESELLGPLLDLTYNFMKGYINDAPVLQSTQTCFRHE
ncbi:lamina-associated polypeptide 2, isoforms beta/gamma-like isoform X1 [Festucalex cinctus]